MYINILINLKNKLKKKTEKHISQTYNINLKNLS